MGAHSYHDLLRHVGHRIVCVSYGRSTTDPGPNDLPDNVAIECETCYEILVDFDLPVSNKYCSKCRQHFAIHNDDGSCVED
jgi:acetyl-CoA carboxylase beta subunit